MFGCYRVLFDTFTQRITVTTSSTCLPCGWDGRGGSVLGGCAGRVTENEADFRVLTPEFWNCSFNLMQPVNKTKGVQVTTSRVKTSLSLPQTHRIGVFSLKGVYMASS